MVKIGYPSGFWIVIGAGSVIFFCGAFINLFCDEPHPCESQVLAWSPRFQSIDRMSNGKGEVAVWASIPQLLFH